MVQLLTLYTDLESHNAQCYRQRDRQTDERQDGANSRSCCVVVRSAKKLKSTFYILQQVLCFAHKRLGCFRCFLNAEVYRENGP